MEGVEIHMVLVYFFSKFTTIEMAMKDVPNYETTFENIICCRIQKCTATTGEGGMFRRISPQNGSTSKGQRSQFVHKSRTAVIRVQSTGLIFILSKPHLNRLRQIGAASVEEWEGLEGEIRHHQKCNEEHCTEAKASHE